MNRAEYKERLARISAAIDGGNFDEALDLLDSINWRKLHNINILLEGSELYERAAKPYDAKELLEIAHERSPMGRMIIYRLALINAKLGEIEAARNYYQRFIEIAPNDNLKYIINYNITKAQGVEDRMLIPILEELKANELIEEWAYELACLYRTTGQVDKCIALLDEIILWFGEGPYVEKSLEMKLLYQPLSEEQADKYTKLTMGDSIVEIRPGDRVAGNEFLGRTIRIPEVEVSSDKFNTVNLQAEIRKNIEEIMKASEMGEVSENMDAIKELVDEIPYLRMEEEKETIEERKFDTSRMNETIKSKFNEFLSEEFDGQISLLVPEGSGEDEQIDGQMTIEDIMERWEKTRRAAQATLSAAKDQELLEYKQKAIARANEVLGRLMESDFTLGDRPVRPVEPAKSPISEEIEESLETNSVIPVVKEIEDTDTKEPEAGIEEAVEEQEPVGASSEAASIEEEETEEKDSKTFVIPQISAEGEAAKGGFEIPVISANDAKVIGDAAKESIPGIETKDSADVVSDVASVSASVAVAGAAAETVSEASSIIEADKALKDINSMLQNEIDKIISEEPGDKEEPKEAEHTGNTGVLPDIAVEATLEATGSVRTALTAREREIFSYFTGVSGMEPALLGVLTGVSEALSKEGRHDTGHIIIQGRNGSGKTKLATDIIRIMQEKIGRPTGSIGRINGSKLNEKDIRVLFDRIKGGALIIEHASKLNKDTIVNLILMMENDTSGILVILEDTKPNIDNLLRMDFRFAKKFTERITIPVMTIDELVRFGRLYAAENGYVIDEMGTLALYDRINIAGRPQQPACIRDVRDILDDAIDSYDSRHRGLFGSMFGNKNQEEDGMMILQEKDFRED